jgi:hypothetical protein
MRTIQEEYDNVLLVNTGDGRYMRYFAQLDRALSTVIAWASEWSQGALCARDCTDYLRGLQACYGILRGRFAFDANDPLMVDVSHAGYPHNYMLARVAVDRKNIAVQAAGTRITTEQLKRVFLDHIFRTGEANPSILHAIACAQYADVFASMGGEFDPRFMCEGPIQESATRYRVQWGSFDPRLNIPTLYGMVFSVTGEAGESLFAELLLVLRHESRVDRSIAMLAHYIDTAIEDVHPLFVTRVTLGPLFLPGFTMGDVVWQQLLEKHAAPDEFIMEIVADHTYSVDTQKPSARAVSFGVSPAETQVYAVEKADQLCFERGAHAVERIVVLPHRIVQILSEEETLNGYTLVPYGKEGLL